jgi:hypothetical protein
MNNPKTVLSIAHHIFLDKNERYQLHERRSVEVIGVSLPIWFHKGSTSEPGEEVFCKYYLTNKEIMSESVKPLGNEGYIMNLPQKTSEDLIKEELKFSQIEFMKEEMSNETKRLLSFSIKTTPTGKNLLDNEDQGSEYCAFKKIDKIFIDGKRIDCFHFVTMMSKKRLENSLEY